MKSLIHRSTLYPYQRQALIWTAIALILGCVIWLLHPILTPFLLGIIFAYILQPGVSWLTRHRVPRTIAVFIMMLLLLVCLVLLISLVLIVVQKQGLEIKNQALSLMNRLQNFAGPQLAEYGINLNFDLPSLPQLLSSRANNGNVHTLIKAILHSIWTSGNFAITIIGHAIMVPVVIYYLLYDWQLLLEKIKNMVPLRYLSKVIELTMTLDNLLSQYLRGQLLVMLILAAYYASSLWLAGFEIGIPIGIFTGLAVFVPYVGFGIGLLLALSAVLFQFNNLYGIVMVAIIYGFGQIMDTIFLTPRFVGKRIGMHPLAVIFALLVFGQLFGIFGVFLAFPASAIVLVITQDLRKIYKRSRLYKN